MNILHFSNKPMYPVLDGGCAAMASLYRCLDQVEKTDHIYLATPKHPYVQDAYPRDLPVPLKQLNVDTTIRPFKAALALLTGVNYNLSRFFCKKVARKLKHLLNAKNYDVVVLESLFLTGYLSVFREAGVKKIIVHTHNVEHTLWEQWAAQSTGWKKWYLKRLAKTLKRDEIALLNQVDGIWAITDEDADLLKQLVPKVEVSTVRVAVDVGLESADYSKSDVFHVGSLNWQPNIDAVDRLQSLFRRMNCADGTRLHIAGSFSGQRQSDVDDAIVWHGYVENLSEFMQNHGVLCSPITSGSGVRIKLLEAIALGVPCITTSLGAAGISDPHSLMMIAEGDDEIIRSMNELVSSMSLRNELGQRGKEYARKYHSFTAITSQLRTLLAV